MPDVDLLKAAHVNNSHGFGIMFLDEDDRVINTKIVPDKYEDIEDVFKGVFAEYAEVEEFGLHFRLNTQGETTPDMSHPFKVLDYNEHGRDLFLMHNGPHLPVPILDTDKSDTYHFVELYLKPILTANPDLVEDNEFWRAIDKMIGNDKMLLLDSYEGFIRVNEQAGTKIPADGLWLSNTYSIRRNKGMNYNPHSKKVEEPKPVVVTPHTPPTYNGYRGNYYSGTAYQTAQRRIVAASEPTSAKTESIDGDDDGFYDKVYSNAEGDWWWDEKANIYLPRWQQELADADAKADDVGGDVAYLGDIAPVETAELVEAFTNDKLYEYTLDNFEGVVSWLRETIKLPKAS
jgi:hypothetical protein